VLHNLRMIGRPAVASCRVDMEHLPTLRRFLGRYLRIADGIEALRGMRVAAIGVNPDVFATTFSNQMELFRLGFSLHTYELLDLWGDVFVGGLLEEDASECEVPFGSLNPSRPIRRDDERLPEIRRIMAGAGCALPADEDVLDALARCLLWLKSTFERDGIDTGAIHCWPQVRRYFPFGYLCGLAMLSNALLDIPLVCEGDLCHAIVAKAASVLSGEPGVILDVNNNGWDPRVFYAFHCSQTPPNWLVGGGQVTPGGFVTGRIAPVPFTGISAATSADAFRATVFSGHFLRQDVGERGSSAWAFVPNFPDVLRAIEGAGIHHFVAMQGDLAEEAAEALRFRGVAVEDLARPVGSLEEIEAELPPMEGGKGQCRVYSQ
jgi:L-fucose isomerase-like protein